MLNLKLVPTPEEKALFIRCKNGGVGFRSDVFDMVEHLVHLLLLSQADNIKSSWLLGNGHIHHRTWYRALAEFNSKGVVKSHRVDNKMVYEIPVYFEEGN